MKISMILLSLREFISDSDRKNVGEFLKRDAADKDLKYIKGRVNYRDVTVAALIL